MRVIGLGGYPLQLIWINLSLLWISFCYDSTSWYEVIATWWCPSRKLCQEQRSPWSLWPRVVRPNSRYSPWRLLHQNISRNKIRRLGEPNEEWHSNSWPSSFVLVFVIVFRKFSFIFFLRKTVPTFAHPGRWSPASTFRHDCRITPQYMNHRVSHSKSSILADTCMLI